MASVASVATQVVAAAMDLAGVAGEAAAVEVGVAMEMVSMALATAKAGKAKVEAEEMAPVRLEKAVGPEATKAEAAVMVVVNAKEARVAVEWVEVVKLVATLVARARASKPTEQRLAQNRWRGH